MNKLFKSLICLALIISTLFALAACGKKPTLDFDKAEENLDDNNYSVERFDGDDAEALALEYVFYALGVKSELIYGVEEVLSASGKKDNSIIIIEFKDTKSASLFYDALKLNRDNAVAELEQELKSNELKLETLKHVLKEYEDDIDEDDIEDAIDDTEDKIEDLKETIKEYDKEHLFGKSGKKVWVGTADAIDAANGK